MKLTAPVKITNNMLKIAGIALVITGTLLALYLRPPVLMVTDGLFTTLYGLDRAKKAQFAASFILRRTVRPIVVSDEASPDVLTLSVEKAYWHPYCVVFPYRYVDAARRYSEQHPKRRVILLSGRVPADSYGLSQDNADSDKKNRFFVLKSDNRLDFFRAGRIAGIFAKDKEGEIPVFLDHRSRMAEREAFLQGLLASSYENSPRFLESFSQLGASTEFPMMVLAGSGMEYLDRSPKPPLMVFTWLDPSLASREINIIVDDSPWAQLTTAVRMARRGKDNEVIPSKIMIFKDHIADKGIIRGLKKAARSSPEKNKAKEGQP